jgi:hypothetical protein
LLLEVIIIMWTRVFLLTLAAGCVESSGQGSGGLASNLDNSDGVDDVSVDVQDIVAKTAPKDDGQCGPGLCCGVACCTPAPLAATGRAWGVRGAILGKELISPTPDTGKQNPDSLITVPLSLLGVTLTGALLEVKDQPVKTTSCVTDVAIATTARVKLSVDMSSVVANLPAGSLPGVPCTTGSCPKPTVPTVPSLPTVPTLPCSLPTGGCPKASPLPTLPSLPGLPGLPTTPTPPSLPSLPTLPGTPSAPSVPVGPPIMLDPTNPELSIEIAVGQAEVSSTYSPNGSASVSIDGSFIAGLKINGKDVNPFSDKQGIIHQPVDYPVNILPGLTIATIHLNEVIYGPAPGVANTRDQAAVAVNAVHIVMPPAESGKEGMIDLIVSHAETNAHAATVCHK